MKLDSVALKELHLLLQEVNEQIGREATRSHLRHLNTFNKAIISFLNTPSEDTLQLATTAASDSKQTYQLSYSLKQRFRSWQEVLHVIGAYSYSNIVYHTSNLHEAITIAQQRALFQS